MIGHLLDTIMKMVTPEKLAMIVKQGSSYQMVDSYKLTEPRIEMIYRRLAALLQVVEMESSGEPVEIDGFRLREPMMWISPVGPAYSELWHISNACNLRCPFCYEEGDPKEGSTLNDPPAMATMEELETRLKYRNPIEGTGLFQPLTYTNEIFCNPLAMEMMERLREVSPGEVFTFVTNGTYLTEAVVARIAKLKPVFFNFSVNSLNPAIRKRRFLDRHPERVIHALQLLRKYRLPYLGSLVCWPTIPWEDIKNTVRELDRAGCAVIRFSFSSYSKFLKTRPFNRQEFWTKGLSVALKLMEEVETPIKIEPYHYMDPTFLANVAGVIKDSPAARAGVRARDQIVKIENHYILTSNHALSALSQTAERSRTVKITYRRFIDGQEIESVLDNAASPFGYPYDELLDFPGFEWGLIIVDNLKLSYLKEMRTIIDKHNAKRVLLCSSEIMKPIVLQMIEQSQAFQDIEVLLEVPENRFFGGNIRLGDLLVVEDFVHFINEYKIRSNQPIDLVIIPSSPFSTGSWRRDLTGTPINEIERRVGIKVEFVPCKPLNG